MNKFMLIVLCFAYSAYASLPLELVNVFPINGPKNLQPSGLTACRGQLLMVSDRHNETIFSLQIENNETIAKTFIKLEQLETPTKGFRASVQGWFFSWLNKTYDWEGLTCDIDNNLYVASETWVALLKVDKNNQMSWQTVPVLEYGKKIGAFKLTNAKVEGVVWFPEHFVFAAERSPRALLQFKENKQIWQLEQAKIVKTSMPVSHNQIREDFSGLLYENHKLYTLERHASLICRRDIVQFNQETCWSYAHVEYDSDFKYTGNHFGLAEGIALFENYLFVVFDNNGLARLNNPKDKRPILLQFKLPENWES